MNKNERDISNNFTTIKMISAGEFEIALLESPQGKYRIVYVTEGLTHDSEFITDYSVATHLFETKLHELKNINN